MSEQELPEDVQQAFELVIQTLTDTFSIEQLRGFIAACRGRPLKLERIWLPPGTTGCALGLQDVDLICLRTRLEPARILPVQLHECSHFLLKHVAKLSSGADTATYQEFLHNRNLHQAIFRDRTTAYDSPRERHAEQLGRLLRPCITRYEESGPRTMVDIYGC